MKFVWIQILCTMFNVSFSQKLLVLNYYSLFGKDKSFQFYNNASFSFKKKGKIMYETHKLVNMQDSLLVFDTDSIIKLSQIKSIRINGLKLSRYFFGVGVLFPLYDTGSNIAYGRETIVNQQALFVSAFCFAGGMIAYYFQDKHIRIRKSATLRIIDNNYQNLNIKH